MPTIETARLRLRPFRPDDVGGFQAVIHSDAEVMRYLPGGQPRPVEKTEAVIAFFIRHQEQHGFSVWALETKADGCFIGNCGLMVLAESGEVEVAYALGKAYWGQGYASEAACASLRYGFESAALPYILALAYPSNIASQRVMQKIGMQHVGLTNAYYNSELVLYRVERAAFQPGEAAYTATA